MAGYRGKQPYNVGDIYGTTSPEEQRNAIELEIDSKLVNEDDAGLLKYIPELQYSGGILDVIKNSTTNVLSDTNQYNFGYILPYTDSQNVLIVGDQNNILHVYLTDSQDITNQILITTITTVYSALACIEGDRLVLFTGDNLDLDYSIINLNTQIVEVPRTEITSGDNPVGIYNNNGTIVMVGTVSTTSTRVYSLSNIDSTPVLTYNGFIGVEFIRQRTNSYQITQLRESGTFNVYDNKMWFRTYLGNEVYSVDVNTYNVTIEKDMSLVRQTTGNHVRSDLQVTPSGTFYFACGQNGTDKVEIWYAQGNIDNGQSILVDAHIASPVHLLDDTTAIIGDFITNNVLITYDLNASNYEVLDTIEDVRSLSLNYFNNNLILINITNYVTQNTLIAQEYDVITAEGILELPARPDSDPKIRWFIYTG